MERSQGQIRSVARGCFAAALITFFVLFAVQAIADSPQVAAITEPAAGGHPLNPADVHMVAEFDDGDGDEHLCSDWEIWTVSPHEPVWRAACVDGPEKIHTHLGDGEFLNSHAGGTELHSGTSYELRVRFRDDSGVAEEEWSEWEVRPFATREPEPAGSETETWTAREGYVVEAFAADLQLPVNIAMVAEAGDHPGDPLMYVTELYGTVKVVGNDGSVGDYATGLLNFDPTGNFPGSGEIGLTGIVVEPDSGDLIVSLVYAEGAFFHPKVVRLFSDEAGLEAVGEETLLDMKGAVQSASHQVSHLELLPDGETLLVHNGDGISGAAQAPQVDSYLGKILRMDLDGEPLPDNPFYTDDGEDTAEDYVWIKGLRNPFGGALRHSDETYWEVENGPSDDRLAPLVGGEDYGWPGDQRMFHRASYRWSLPHAPVNIEFVEPATHGGSQFPAETMGHAFVTESGPTWASGRPGNGKRIVEFGLAGDGGLLSGPDVLAEYTGVGKATAVGLAAGPDGLYFTDLYKDVGYGSPIDRGANVLRVRYCGDSCPAEEEAEEPVTRSPPQIVALALSKKRFRLSRRARLAYRLSSRARVWISIRPLTRGWRMVGGRGCGLLPRAKRERLRRDPGLRACVLPEARGVRVGGRCRPAEWSGANRPPRAARCVRHFPRGVVRGSGRAGRNSRLVPLRLAGHRLRPGPYVATVRARDGDGLVAVPKSLSFRVLAGR